jgi:CheY-like chemotaxis protein
MEKLATLLHAIASLAWPLIVALIVFYFRGIIRTVLESAKSRKFTVKVAGNELTMDEANEQQRVIISDLQKQIVNIQNTVGLMLGEPAPMPKSLESKPEEVKTVLWVDDNPKNNSYLIANLSESGVEIITALSTSEALSKFTSRRIDRVISDMGRREGIKYNQTAGLDLIRQIRAMDPNVPILIYCSRRAAQTYEQEAKSAGANVITSSPSVLLNALRLGIERTAI